MPPKMTKEMASQELETLQKVQFRFDQLSKNLDHATGRENSYSKQFIETEMQIASIILGIVGASAVLKDDLGNALLMIAVDSVFLILSLAFGLIAIHVLQKFWNTQMRIARSIHTIWRNYLLQGGNYAQAEKDAMLISGSQMIVESPRWPYYFQTIFLVIGATLLVGQILYLVITTGKAA